MGGRLVVGGDDYRDRSTSSTLSIIILHLSDSGHENVSFSPLNFVKSTSDQSYFYIHCLQKERLHVFSLFDVQIFSPFVVSQ